MSVLRQSRGAVGKLQRGAIVMENRAPIAIDKHLLDQLLSGRDPNEQLSRDGPLDELK